jgi:hypothetical protein
MQSESESNKEPPVPDVIEVPDDNEPEQNQAANEEPGHEPDQELEFMKAEPPSLDSLL